MSVVAFACREFAFDGTFRSVQTHTPCCFHWSTLWRTEKLQRSKKKLHANRRRSERLNSEARQILQKPDASECRVLLVCSGKMKNYVFSILHAANKPGERHSQPPLRQMKWTVLHKSNVHFLLLVLASTASVNV